MALVIVSVISVPSVQPDSPFNIFRCLEWDYANTPGGALNFLRC